MISVALICGSIACTTTNDEYFARVFSSGELQPAERVVDLFAEAHGFRIESVVQNELGGKIGNSPRTRRAAES